jgi:membrane-bound lytic murein transglycosylase D
MDMRKGNTGWFVALFTSILLIAVLFMNFDTKNEGTDLFRALKHKDAISSLILPGEVEFAGEKVPLGNFDTRESLEREIIVNTYWHSQTLLLLKRSKRYFPTFDSILSHYGIPLDFKYLAVAESGLEMVVSPSNAVGFWQFLEGTAGDYNMEVNDMVDERYHVEKSTEAACKYLLESYNKYGNWTMAAASYNRGRRFISEQIEKQKQNSYYNLLLGQETERYLFRIIAFKLLFENPGDYGFIVKDEGYKPIPYYNFKVIEDIEDFGSFAIEHQTNYKILKKLNPWLRQNYLLVRDNREYVIKLPQPGARESLND